MATEANAPMAHERADERPHKKEVSITINGNAYEVHRGPAGVEHLKHIAHIGHNDVLEQELHGHLHRLPDDGAVEIHGGEVFVSKPKLVVIKINTVDYEVHPGRTPTRHQRPTPASCAAANAVEWSRRRSRRDTSTTVAPKNRNL